MKELILNRIEALSPGEILCVDVSTIYAYRDGHYTEEAEGTKYILVLPSMQYQRIEVRTKEQKPNQAVMNALEEEDNCRVEVVNFKARITPDFTRRELRISCTADTVRVDDEILVTG